MALAPLSQVEAVQRELGIRCLAKPPTYAQVKDFLTSLVGPSSQSTAVEPLGSSMPPPLMLSSSSSAWTHETRDSVAGNSYTSSVCHRGAAALVVDDLLLNRVMLSKMLEHLSVRSVFAENGEEAVRVCAQQAFDVIFMDCHMPVLDGFEASRRIRALPFHVRTPIVAVTAATSEQDRERCMSCGMTHFLCKPIDSAELERMVNEVRSNTSASSIIF
jgi:CheY-like chemotaxis protein